MAVDLIRYIRGCTNRRGSHRTFECRVERNTLLSGEIECVSSPALAQIQMEVKMHNCGGCKHEKVSYCPKCQKVYCDGCGKEWDEPCTLPHYYYGQWYSSSATPSYKPYYGTTTITDKTTCAH